MDKVKEIATKVRDFLKEKLGKISKRTKIITAASVGVLLVSLIVFGIIVNQTGYAVLYSDVSSSEATEILTALRDELNVTDVKLTDGNILVSEKQVDELRMQLSILGYPKSTFNYNIWDTGVSMFSTDTEKREKQRQQLQTLLMATLDTIPGVDKSYVIINLPENKDYVLSTSKSNSSATVMLHLKNGIELEDEQIDGIYNLVQNAIPDITRDYITLTDGDGKMLFKSDEKGTNENESIDSLKRLYYTKLDIRNELQQIYYDTLNSLFDGAFKEFSVAVTVDMTYGTRKTESTTYTPSVEEDGTKGGMVSDKTTEVAAQGTAATGGTVGTTVDSDISPDYPTVDWGEGDDVMYDYRDTTNYLVNKVTEQYENDGFDIKGISATVIVEETNMTQAEIETWQQGVANAIGADVNNVTFIPHSFVLEANSAGSGGAILAADGNNTLVFIIISLGVVLIILFVLAIVTSGSKKKRQVRAQKAAAAALASGGAQIGGIVGEEGGDNGDVYGLGALGDPKKGNGELEIPSLLETSNEEAREAILKREIREFAKSNPEIVAQLIRTWMKSED